MDDTVFKDPCIETMLYSLSLTNDPESFRIMSTRSVETNFGIRLQIGF